MTDGDAPRLYAATGDAIATLDAVSGGWTAKVSLAGSGAQCVAVDPDDPDTVYAGLRDGASAARRTVAVRGSTAGFPLRRCSRWP